MVQEDFGLKRCERRRSLKEFKALRQKNYRVALPRRRVRNFSSRFRPSHRSRATGWHKRGGHGILGRYPTPFMSGPRSSGATDAELEFWRAEIRRRLRRANSAAVLVLILVIGLSSGGVFQAFRTERSAREADQYHRAVVHHFPTVVRTCYGASSPASDV
jgi:hypothetical protein